MKVALAGATGNMGRETLKEILKIDEIELVRILVLPKDKIYKTLIKQNKKHKHKIEVLFGNLKDQEICDAFVDGVDYVLNLAAVIPPHSDKNPQNAVDCNEIGVDRLVSSIERRDKQPKFIHISTLALYGNRNYNHPFVRVGDPLLVSPFDIYSATKMRGEFRVLESSIKVWAIIRQTAVLHMNMLKDNMSDGLMFHTCFNAPLEWVTAHDSGVLLRNILKKDINGELKNKFWKQVYNLGGGADNRITGYDTLNDGFKLIGGSTKGFFKPYFNATRNFHGAWFYDSERLNYLFDYLSQSVNDYWKEIGRKYGYYKFGKIVPKSLIRKIAIERLFKDDNSPAYWYAHNDEAKLTAYFGGKSEYEKLKNVSWDNFYLLRENKTTDGEDSDYNSLRDVKKARLINYYYDMDKKDEEIDMNDLISVATAHGGKLLSKSFKKGDIYTKLDWETQDGEKFTASAFTVLRAGHWFHATYKENIWDFDRLAKKDKIFAQIWYDSHDKNENHYYYLDKNYKAGIK